MKRLALVALSLCAGAATHADDKAKLYRVEEGVFEVVDVQVATFAILALLTGLCTWYRPGGRLTKEAIVEAHEKLVLSGVALSSSGAAAPARSKRKPARSLAVS